MALNIKPPSQGIGSTEERVKGLYSYLYQLAEQLNIALAEAEKSGAGSLKSALGGGNTLAGGKTPDTTTSAYQQLKALITKTATEVTGNIQRLVREITQDYVAQSEYGTYSEYLSAKITGGADGVLVKWDAENGITANVGEFAKYIANSDVYMRAGIVKYNDDGTVEAGVVIGKELTKVTIDGKEIITSQNVYSLLTADTLSFWQDGVKRAEVGLEEFFVNKAYIDEVTTSLLQSDTFGAQLALRDDVLSAIAGKINLQANDSVKTLVSNAEQGLQSQIDAVPGQITLAVKSVQVGGTNLLRNGGFYQGLEGWERVEYNVNGDWRNLYVETGASDYRANEVPNLVLHAQNETGMFGATQTVYGLRKNTDYTISGYVASHRCNRAAIEIRNPEGTRWQFGHVWDVGWGGTNLAYYDRFAYTFNTGDDSDVKITLYSNSFGENAYVWWAQVKLEEGDRATAWSPSPFDPAEGVKTSYIEIADDHIDISSGGNVNIEAGSALNVNSGTFDVTTGDFSMSLTKDDGTDVVMDIDDDGHTTFKAVHAGNVREAEYGYKYYNTASMGSLQAMADYLARTDARALEYQMSADEYGHVTLKEYSGYFKIYAAGHKLPKITVANSFTGTLWISTGYLSSEGGAYGDKWALTVDGGNVFTTNCWFAPGTTAGIMVEYGGTYRWLNWNDLSTETGYTLDPFIYASGGGIAHVIGGIPAGGRDIWHGFIYEGAYLSEHGGTGGSGSTVSTASAAGTLGYYGSSNGWHAGECFQGYSNAKGRAYGCLAFDLSGVGTIQSAKLTLHRKSGVGLNRKANVTVYGTTADRGSNPANGLTSAYVSAEGLIGWDGSATLDVTAAAQALKAGTIKQLVIYTGETGVYSGKVYSYHYAQFDSATMEVAYT